MRRRRSNSHTHLCVIDHVEWEKKGSNGCVDEMKNFVMNKDRDNTEDDKNYQWDKYKYTTTWKVVK